MTANAIEAIEKVGSGLFSDADLEQLYQFCLVTARKHVYFLNSIQGKNPGNTLFSQSINDEAQTYVAKLFTPVRQTGRMLIQELWQRYRDSLLPYEVEPEDYLVSMVRRVVSNQRNDVMRYQQPQEWRIRRSIRLAVLTVPFAGIKKIGNTNYVVNKNETPSVESALSQEELQDFCLSVFKGITEVASLARASLQVLQQQNNGNRCFKLEHLYFCIIRHFAAVYEIDQQTRNSISSAELTMILNSAVVQPARDYLEEIVDSIYVEKNKVPIETGEAFKTILGHYLEDFFSDRSTQVTTYVEETFTPAEAEEFLNLHRNKLYYLLTMLRERLQRLAAAFIGDTDRGRLLPEAAEENKRLRA